MSTNENCAIACGPPSETSNSSGLRSRTMFPCESVATMSTVTKRVLICKTEPGFAACCGGGVSGDCCWADTDDTEREFGEEDCSAAIATVAAAKRIAEPTNKFFARIRPPSSLLRLSYARYGAFDATIIITAFPKFRFRPFFCPPSHAYSALHTTNLPIGRTLCKTEMLAAVG
jgi:hypothetical protein